MLKKFLKVSLLSVFTCGIFVIVHGYDLNNKALTPVTHQKAAIHAPIKLIKNGELRFAIAVDPDAEFNKKGDKCFKRSAKTLADAFEKCTGKRPAIISTSDAGKYPYVIYIGASQMAKKAGIDPMKLPVQGFTVRTFAKGVFIVGNDSVVDPDYKKKPLDYRGSSIGTFYGTCDFAERILGVRYFYPGKYGTYAPAIKNLELKPFAYMDYPRFKTRGFAWYMYVSFENDKMMKYWEPYMGKLPKRDTSFGHFWRMGSTLSPGGAHCPRPDKIAIGYPDKLKKIFYTSPGGRFWYNPRNHIGNYYDVVNLEFADILLDACRKFYKSNGKIDLAGFGNQVNSEYISFGVCDTYMPVSEVLADPRIRKMGLITQKDIDSDPDGAMRNVYGRFYQYLGKKIKREFPDKRLFILAYYNSKCAPDAGKWKLPDNVEIYLCDGRLPLKTRNKAEMQKSKKLFESWYAALGNRPILRLWLYNTRSNPFARAVAGEFVGDVPKLLGKYMSPEGGMFFDLNGGKDFWHYYYSLYAACRSQWNPAWNVDVGIDEHWNLFYGPKAGPYLKEFHRILKKAYIDYAVPSSDAMAVYPPRVIDQLEKNLKMAGKQLKPGTVEFRRYKLFAAPWPKNLQTMRNRLAYEAPTYNVYRLLSAERVSVKSPTIETFWKKAKIMPLQDTRTGIKQITYPTIVKLAWDNKALYGLMESSFDPAPDNKKDIWHNNGFELLFSPGMNKEVKYQLAFDITGQKYSSMQRLLPIPQPVDLQWKAPGFQFYNFRKDGKWYAKFRVPFSVFGKKVQVYDSWNFNLVRNKVTAPREIVGSSLTLGNNHNTAMFGIIRFAGKGE